MTISPNSDLACLAEGTRFLARRPRAVLGIALLGMALSALAPALQLRLGIPDGTNTNAVVMFAALLPLDLYFIPRFLMEADAEAGGNPFNAAADWKVRFEERWLRAFMAKVWLGLGLFCAMLVLLVFAAGSGLGPRPQVLLLAVATLLALLAFGWAPLRVLLRGETFRTALQGSLGMLTRSWQPMVRTAMPLGVAYLAGTALLVLAEAHFVPTPTLAQLALHPVFVATHFASMLLSLWLSAGLLALFRRLDPVAPAES